ncbi:hypothetical protein IPC561_09890 [Pseudomonas aeruginosa]|uniref:hypothetical protein n=1 Tax=Pseudomonas aeruginosa TaxID=287 RepID=UPI000F88C321|nr:hypothetical protein [Pseudomonas aeruginosa]RUG80534.1 hypothetical protein IPC561_09890 [Pseudomonas aeruginosa]
MQVKGYKISELSDVPAVPGIYAWYGVLHLGAADLKRELDQDNKDLGAKRFRESLSRRTGRFSPPPFSVSLKSSFRDGWSGAAAPTLFEKYVAVLSHPDGELSAPGFTYPAKAIERMCSTEKNRVQLNRLIDAATPVFSAPLYVGKSSNLKRRLGEHVAALSKFSELAAANSEFLEKLRKKISDPSSEEISADMNFAMRAVSAGFTSDHLKVYIMEVESCSTLQDKDATAGAEALEWLLNSWNRPVLGRE